jgi:outer membrane lipoprotein SlyB
MKTTVLLSFLFLTLIFNNVVFAQNKTTADNLFVRVYNLEGVKISKGEVLSVSDTLLQLNRKGLLITINYQDIGMIKTKRSEGNNILVGSVIGASAGAITGAIIGIETAEPDEWFGFTEEEGAAIGFILGVPAGAAIGAAIGGITLLFKKSKTFFVNGDILKWKLFQEASSN